MSPEEAARLLFLDLRRWAVRFDKDSTQKIETVWKAIISIAYRDRAFNLHPDRHPGDKDKYEIFLKVQEARKIVESITRRDLKEFLPPPPAPPLTEWEYFTQVLCLPVFEDEMERQRQEYLRNKGVVFNSPRWGIRF